MRIHAPQASRLSNFAFRDYHPRCAICCGILWGRVHVSSIQGLRGPDPGQCGNCVADPLWPAHEPIPDSDIIKI